MIKHCNTVSFGNEQSIGLCYICASTTQTDISKACCEVWPRCSSSDIPALYCRLTADAQWPIDVNVGWKGCHSTDRQTTCPVVDTTTRWDQLQPPLWPLDDKAVTLQFLTRFSGARMFYLCRDFIASVDVQMWSSSHKTCLSDTVEASWIRWLLRLQTITQRKQNRKFKVIDCGWFKCEITWELQLSSPYLNIL